MKIIGISIVIHYSKGVFRKKVSQKREISYKFPKNNILQLLSQLHQNPIRNLEVMSRKVDFRPFLTTNPP